MRRRVAQLRCLRSRADVQSWYESASVVSRPHSALTCGKLLAGVGDAYPVVLQRALVCGHRRQPAGGCGERRSGGAAARSACREGACACGGLVCSWLLQACGLAAVQLAEHACGLCGGRVGCAACYCCGHGRRGAPPPLVRSGVVMRKELSHLLHFGILISVLRATEAAVCMLQSEVGCVSAPA